ISDTHYRLQAIIPLLFLWPLRGFNNHRFLNRTLPFKFLFYDGCYRSDTLNKAFAEAFLSFRIYKLIFKRRASAVYYKYFHDAEFKEKLRLRYQLNGEF